MSNEEEAKAIQLKADVDALAVVDDATYETAGALATGIKTLVKKIEDHYKPLKKAASDAHKAITKSEKDMLEMPNATLGVLRGKVERYFTEKEKARKEAEAEYERASQMAVEEALDSRTDSKPVGLILPDANIPDKPKAAGLGMREVWSFVVEDYAKLPMKFLMPNQQALDEEARYSKDATNIPGGRAEMRYSSTVRS
jgi:hypothetical protein